MKLSISFMPSDIPQLPEHYHFRVPPSIGDDPRNARRAFFIIQGQTEMHNGGLAGMAGTWPGFDAVPDSENRTKRTHPQAKGTPRTKRTVRYVVPTCQAENEGHGKGAEERRKSRQRPFRYTRVGYRRPMVSPQVL